MLTETATSALPLRRPNVNGRAYPVRQAAAGSSGAYTGAALPFGYKPVATQQKSPEALDKASVVPQPPHADVGAAHKVGMPHQQSVSESISSFGDDGELEPQYEYDGQIKAGLFHGVGKFTNKKNNECYEVCFFSQCF